MKLVLFDIDGTLLNTGAFGVKSLEKAAENITGKKPKYDLTKFIGMSDKHNFAYMYSCAAGKAPSAKQLEAVKEEYLSLLPSELAALKKNKKYKAASGVEKFIKTLLSFPDVKLALATGNVEEAAKIKLAPAGLDKYFVTGGFGWDGAERTELLKAAVKRASKTFKHKFTSDEVYVIGDTHLDVVAAKENGYHSAVVKEAGLADKERLLRAAAEAEVDTFKDEELLLVWLDLRQDPKGVEKGSYIMPASAIEHVFFSRTGIDEQRLKMFRIKKYSDLESGKIW